MRFYKLTDSNGQTRGETQWGEGITHRAAGPGKELCSKDVIHVYSSPLGAVLFNPIHSDFANPTLWECKVRGVVARDQLKVGVKQCTTVRKVPLPVVTPTQRVHFAILCALEVDRSKTFTKWAHRWLSGEDRTAEAAKAAEKAAARRTTWAADAATWATGAARSMAEAMVAWITAAAAAAEAKEAEVAPRAAAAAAAAVRVNPKINLLKLLKCAIKKEKTYEKLARRLTTKNDCVKIHDDENENTAVGDKGGR